MGGAGNTNSQCDGRVRRRRGGGYSCGDGGTSYDTGLNPSFSLAASPANGSVTINGVTEPTSLCLLSFAGATLLRRRRHPC
jgi:hypothetical protein